MGKKHKKHKKRPAAPEEPLPEEEEKPLPKLVLKVTKEEKTIEESTASSDDPEKSGHKDKHKKKKKKDKKHKHKHEESKKVKKRERSGKEDELEPPVKKIHIRVADLPREEEPVQEKPKEPTLSSLQLCLENLHRTFQRKDVYGIFSYPVTDAIAPNYSKIIKNPMDFSTMMFKIENRQYPNIETFKDDFILMCNNAMTYNAPDTIYYKGAEKMLAHGMKSLSEDKIQRLKKSIGIVDDDMLSNIDDQTMDEGSLIDVDSVADEDVRRASSERRKRESKHKTRADILEVARVAAENVQKQLGNSKIGFLRKDEDGNTSLAILNPDIAGDRQSYPVNLGKIAGKVQSGTPATSAYKEDKKNKVIPVSYLVYGPYGSFGPTYDSSLSTLSKEESNLILNTYGNEAGVHYAKSLRNFVKDASNFAQDLVDKFLDALTEGSHSKWLRHQEQKERKKLLESKLANQANVKSSEKSMEKQTKENRSGEDAFKSAVDNLPESSGNSSSIYPSSNASNSQSEADVDLSKIDFNSLMSLQNEGIDVSFLKDLVPQAEEKKKQEEEKQEIQSKLEGNAELLTGLKQAQNERLLKKAEVRRTVSEKELSLAESLTQNLQTLLAKVQPKDVSSTESIRAAMGIGLVPTDNQDIGMTILTNSKE